MIRHAPLFVPALWLASCGYVGEPLPPALYIPRPVSDLRVVQRGDLFHIDFTIPALTTDGLALRRLGGVEMTANDGRLPVTAEAPGPVSVTVPVTGLVGRRVRFRVRVASHRDRWSEWSAPVELEVIRPLDPPRAVQAEAVASGVRLSWETDPARPGLGVRIRRRSSGEKEFQEVAAAAGREWIDHAARFGETYEYSVQTVFQEAESEWAEPVSITPQDRFPPSTPANLTAIAGLGSIELAWERSAEEDTASYRVYRAAGDGPFSQVADTGLAPSFSDREVSAGTVYRYGVTAVDQRGNESAQSATVEITAP